MVTGEEPRTFPAVRGRVLGPPLPTTGLRIREDGERGRTVWESPWSRVLESQALSEKREGNVGWRHPTPPWSLRKVSNAVGGPRAKVGH